MALSDATDLRSAGRRIRSFPLGPMALEIGSDPDCDVVIHADGVPARALLVHPHGGTAYACDLARAPGLGVRSVLPIGEQVPVGAGCSITRLKADRAPSEGRGTELLPRHGEWPRRLVLVGGLGASARAFPIGEEPVSVGVAPDNTVALSDRAVSKYHCRIEPSSRSVSIRDLRSTNGTWVDGLRIRRHELRPGAVIRVGRTELRVQSAGDDGSWSSPRAPCFP